METALSLISVFISIVGDPSNFTVDSVQRSTDHLCVDFTITQPGASHVCVKQYYITASTDSGMEINLDPVVKGDSDTNHAAFCITTLCSYTYTTFSVFAVYYSGNMSDSVNTSPKISYPGKIS